MICIQKNILIYLFIYSNLIYFKFIFLNYFNKFNSSKKIYNNLKKKKLFSYFHELYFY